MSGARAGQSSVSKQQQQQYKQRQQPCHHRSTKVSEGARGVRVIECSGSKLTPECCLPPHAQTGRHGFAQTHRKQPRRRRGGGGGGQHGKRGAPYDLPIPRCVL